VELRIETPKFIHSQFIEDITLADKIVEFFHSHSFLHTLGGAKKSTEDEIDYTIKKSTDINIRDQLHIFPVFKELEYQIQKVLNVYLDIYPRCNALDSFYLTPYNIQYYKPEEGFLEWHCETPCGEQPYVSRVLTFMMNCNTSDGGTEFLHQDFISTSEKGKLTIFPADWTFTHRGLPASKEKMIVTGWWNFEQV